MIYVISLLVLLKRSESDPLILTKNKVFSRSVKTDSMKPTYRFICFHWLLLFFFSFDFVVVEVFVFVFLFFVV